MEHNPHRTCPTEVYDCEAATEVLLCVYERQETCAHLHQCARQACAIKSGWPQSVEPANKGIASQSLFGFVVRAFKGPDESP